MMFFNSKTRDRLVFGIGIIHLLITLWGITGTAFFRDSAVTRFYNTLFFPNYCYYGISCVLIAMAVLLPSKYIKTCNDKSRIVSYLILCVSALLVIAVSCWINYYSYADFSYMYNVASSFPSNVDSSDMAWYFRRYPYQLNLTTIFGISYYFFHSWRLIVLMGAFLGILSCILLFKTLINITGNFKVSTIALIIALSIVCLNRRTYQPYTDIWGMLFPISIIYIYTTRIKSIFKIILIIMLAGIGSLIKITIIIPCIAILIVELLFKIKNISLKKICAITTSIVLSSIFFGIIVPKGIQQVNNFTPNPDEEFGLARFFLVGQNAQYGINNTDDNTYCSSFHTKQERNNACVKKAFSRITERKFWGNLKFYTRKLIVAMGDGLFMSKIATPEHWILEQKDFFPGSFLLNGARYFQLYAGLEQVLWNLVLLLILISPLFYKDRIIIILSLTFLGYLIYLLIFENCSRYLFLPVPLFVMLASLSLWELRLLLNKFFYKSLSAPSERHS